MNFLSKEVVQQIAEVFHERYPHTFFPERVQAVGIDVPVETILDHRLRPVESHGGAWRLESGSYQFEFGFSFPEALWHHDITPRMFWRSSNHRLGAGGGSLVAKMSKEPTSSADLLRGGPVVGTYQVWNPYGIVIEEGASVAQACFVDGRSFAAKTVSELLVPAQIQTFRSAGAIGQSRTTLPETNELPPANGAWRVERNKPYIAEFEQPVALSDDEVLTPTRHAADEVGNHALGFFNQHSCLGDPGYHGNLGMLVVPMTDLHLRVDQGIARVAKHRVVRVGELGRYKGQWQGTTDDAERVMEFRSIFDWPELIGVQMPDLESLLKD